MIFKKNPRLINRGFFFINNKIIKYLQEENNTSLECTRQCLLEGINAANMLVNCPDRFPEQQAKRVIENLVELSVLYYDLEKLAKP